MTQQPFSRPGAIDLSGLGQPAPQVGARPGGVPTGGAPTGTPAGGGSSYSVVVDEQNFQSLLEQSMTAPVLLVFYSRTRMPESGQLADDLETVTESEVIKYSASGFRDFTRLAASDPTMWRDVCLHNKDAILEMLARFSEDLAYLQRAIRWGDGEKLFDLFTRTRAIRRSIIDAGQDTAAPNFGRPVEDKTK